MRVRSVDDLPALHRETARSQLSARVTAPPLGQLPRPAPALTRAQAALTGPKYHNEPVRVGAERYDSKLEWRCAEWLKAKCTAGALLWFTRQVPFILEGGVRYRADFLASLAAGGVWVLDAKGRDTQASSNKRKQVLARYGVRILLWPEDFE